MSPRSRQFPGPIGGASADRLRRRSRHGGNRFAIAWAALAIPILASCTQHADGEEWRALHVSRQLRDSTDHRVTVQYAAGRLELGAAGAGSRALYDMRLRYDQSAATALHGYSPSENTLRVGAARASRMEFGRASEGAVDLRLARSVPLDLSLELGAVDATVDMTGLSVKRLVVDAGASETRVRFDSLNPIPMETLEIHAGAASMHVTGLANAGVDDVTVEAGVGSVELDFDGEWTRDIAVAANVGLGVLTIRVPSHVGIVLNVDELLASVDAPGLTNHGEGHYMSENRDSARYHVHIAAGAGVGAIHIERTGARQGRAAGRSAGTRGRGER